MERGDSKVPLGISLHLVACPCSEIKHPNMPGVRALVFFSICIIGLIGDALYPYHYITLTCWNAFIRVVIPYNSHETVVAMVTMNCTYVVVNVVIIGAPK